MLDEYERAISDLKNVIEDIPDSILARIVNLQTTDENCQSIQTILSHVVSSGYGYATSIHNGKGHNTVRPGKTFQVTIAAYLQDLTNLFSFTEDIFKNMDDSELRQLDNSLKIKTGWGQSYDIEQLTEHAIVHILRHRRQIERIKRNV